MEQYLGFGGLGDCFIVGLKVLEQNTPEYLYTHVDSSHNRAKIDSELLTSMGINHTVLVVSDIKTWWYSHHNEYDKCFNVFAKGYIDIPKLPYHWEPCKDEGYVSSFSANVSKTDTVAVQVNAGVGVTNRSYHKRPLVFHTLDLFPNDMVVWLGTDSNFSSSVGVNKVGQTSLKEAMDIIQTSKAFIGFPSFFLYWALYNNTPSYIFIDHQGTQDLRIHPDWKSLITYLE